VVLTLTESASAAFYTPFLAALTQVRSNFCACAIQGTVQTIKTYNKMFVNFSHPQGDAS